MNAPPSMPESGPLKRMAIQFNKLRNFAISNRISQGIGYRTHITTAGTVLNIASTQTVVPASASGVQKFVIGAVYDKYLSCQKVDADGNQTNLDTFYIAKPVDLQVTTGSAEYVNQNTRKFFIPSDSEKYVTEQIRPNYGDGEYIYAVKPIGETSVADPFDPTMKLKWQDLNVEARHWLPIYTKVNVCVNGTTHVIYVAGGPVF